MASAVPALRDVDLDDKYALDSGRVYLTGAQAFVRLLILQRQRDALAGLNTAGFVSGYRGSPLGALDQSLWKAQKFLDRAHIKFQPGLNEDLAATAVWGSQQVNLYPGAKYDGVFAMWYGKGPGRRPLRRRVQAREPRGHVEARRRAGAGRRRPRRQVVDAAAPVGPHVLGGDDAGALSVERAGDPRPRPAWLGDVALLGPAGSGFKCVADTVESSSSVYIDPEHTNIIVPDDFPLPPDGLSIRWPDPFLATEARMQNYKVYAALHYCRVNKLNKVVIDSPKPRLGIITSGKSYLDVRQALDDLGITEADAADIGLRRLQGRDAVAARARWRAPVRGRPGGDPRRRGKAPGRRVPAEGAALQLARRRAPARGRQVRREGRMGAPARRLAAARALRAHAGDDRARDRAAHRAPGPAATAGREAESPRRLDQRQGSRAREAAGSRSSARRGSAPAARTTRRPTCPKAAARPPASAAT